MHTLLPNNLVAVKETIVYVEQTHADQEKTYEQAKRSVYISFPAVVCLRAAFPCTIYTALILGFQLTAIAQLFMQKKNNYLTTERG
jgi:hypothetical protein